MAVRKLTTGKWICECYPNGRRGERFHKTMKMECYDVMFRRKIYQELDEIQRDINQWLYFYNCERPHSGRSCYGKTPWQTWESSKGLAKEKQLESLFIASDISLNV